MDNVFHNCSQAETVYTNPKKFINKGRHSSAVKKFALQPCSFRFGSHCTAPRTSFFYGCPQAETLYKTTVAGLSVWLTGLFLIYLVLGFGPTVQHVEQLPPH